MIHRHSDTQMRRILASVRTVAAVGLSLNQLRPSFFVGRYLDLKGFKILAVNPRYAGQRLFGHPVYESLSAIPESEGPIHMVDIFRRSEEAGAVVDEALETLMPRGLGVIWMQIGDIDEAAAAKAEARGLTVVMDRCPKIEYQRLHGELSWGGFNTGRVSARLS